MIEKLKVVIKPEDWKLPVDELEMRCLKNLLLKVDELVDAVNELQKPIYDPNTTKGLSSLVEPAETPIISKMENVAENWKFAKIAQDPYAEQRRWIGKLCKFWDDDAFVTSNDWAFGILTSIDKGMQYQYCCNENCNFKHCEPVKPDSDIIYKGE